MRPIYGSIYSAMMALRYAMKMCHEHGRPDWVAQLEVLERQVIELKHRVSEEEE